MQDVFGLFDIDTVCDDLYNALYNSLLEFSKTKDNKDVYSIAVVCSSETGNIWLRCINKHWFKESCKYFISKWNYTDKDLYGLEGLEYNIGDFKLMDFHRNDNLVYFHHMYYFFNVKHYYGEHELPREFRTLDNSAVFEIELLDYDNIPPYAELIIPDDKEFIYIEIKFKYIEMIRDIILKVVVKLKQNTTFIDKTSDFIIFASDCEQSTEFNYEFMLKTVDKELFDKLLNKEND